MHTVNNHVAARLGNLRQRACAGWRRHGKTPVRAPYSFRMWFLEIKICAFCEVDSGRSWF